MLFITKSVHKFFFFVLLLNIFKLQQTGIRETKHLNAFDKTIASTFEVRTLESLNSTLRCLISANQLQIDERPKK